MTQTEQSTPKIRLGLDLDGVIYNFVDEFREYYSIEHGLDPEELSEVTRWEFYRDWGMTDEEYFIELGKAAINSKVFTKGEPYPHAQEQILRLKELGFEIVIITARNVSNNPTHMELIHKNTAQWLIDQNIAFDELIIDNDKTRHNLDILVDDNIWNVEAQMLAGKTGYVFDRPWNREENIYLRVMGWYDLVREMTLVQEQMQNYIEQTSSKTSV